ncbi:CDGSH iron-sulfur domain-containing protein [Streptomyces sp. AJS327]|nr:CDGSH iron-sulfur domain-containing protein [Streptomyces sp. AJS327]
MEPGGPILVEGPVEVTLPDGGIRRSGRFMVAVCRCGMSADPPWCDTSHRNLPSGGHRAPGPGSAPPCSGPPPEAPAAEERDIP